jgi:hypothetical protein
MNFRTYPIGTVITSIKLLQVIALLLTTNFVTDSFILLSVSVT